MAMHIIKSNICMFLASYYFVSRIYASITITDFRKVNDLYIAMNEAGVNVPAVSRLSCAATCLKQKESCSGFTYNKQTAHCTLGSSLLNVASPRPSSSVLYAKVSDCDRSNNFTKSTKGNVSACLSISDIKLSYTDARTVCEGFNSHLYTIKVIDKLSIMRDEMTAKYPDSSYTDTWVWVGLNNIETKDVYRWEDDGAVLNMSSPYKSQIFHPTQPNNLDDSQRCIAYSSFTYYPLIDYYCNTQLLFICERKIFT